jgi:hypothetical protein
MEQFRIIKFLMCSLAIFQFGCASVATSPRYKDSYFSSFPEIKYNRCILTIALIGDDPGASNSVLAEETVGLDEFQKSLSSELIKNKICRNVEQTDFVTEEWIADLDSSDENIFAKRPFTEIRDDVVKIEVFQKKDKTYLHWPLVPYAINGLFYAASLGFIPMWLPQSKDIFIAVTKKDVKKNSILILRNKNSIWMWTPLYLFGGKNIDLTTKENQEEMDRGLKVESLKFLAL